MVLHSSTILIASGLSKTKCLAFSTTLSTWEKDFSLTPSFSYGVILSQECDIDQHYCRIEKNSKETEEDKKSDDQVIETILVCPAFPLEKFLIGDHIKEKRMPAWNNKQKEKFLF